jgi:oligoendopeptidase F
VVQNAKRLIESLSVEYREYLKHKRLLGRQIPSTMEVTGINALVKIYDRMTSGFEFVMTIRKGKKQ